MQFQPIASEPLVHDEKPGPCLCRRAVCAVVIGDLVAHHRPELETPAVLQLREQRPLEHEQDMSAAAPVVRHVPGCVLNEPDPDVSRLERPPERLP